MDTDTGIDEKALSENRVKIRGLLNREIVFSQHKLSNIPNVEISKDMFRFQILKGGKIIGSLDLQTFPLNLQILVSDIEIKQQRQGNGWIVYNELGEYLTSNNLEFRSSGTQNNGALEIWERFYREGKATLIEDNIDPTRRIYKFVGKS